MTSKKIDDATIERLIRQGIPGFGDAFVDQLMERLEKNRPFERHTNRPLKNLDKSKLKYSILVKVQKKSEKSKNKPFVMPENEIKKIWKELHEQKLIVQVQGKQGYEITNRGRKYIREFSECQKEEK